jgi:hypothetical protein
MFACASITSQPSPDLGPLHYHALALGGLLSLSLAMLVMRGRTWAVAMVPAALSGMLALHPAWTSASHDRACGPLPLLLACCFTLMGCVALGIQAWQFWDAAGEESHDPPVS